MSVRCPRCGEVAFLVGAAYTPWQQPIFRCYNHSSEYGFHDTSPEGYAESDRAKAASKANAKAWADE